MICLTLIWLRNAISMNSIVLAKAAEVWVSVFDYEGSGSRPRTLPVRPTLHQAWRKCEL